MSLGLLESPRPYSRSVRPHAPRRALSMAPRSLATGGLRLSLLPAETRGAQFQRVHPGAGGPQRNRGSCFWGPPVQGAGREGAAMPAASGPGAGLPPPTALAKPPGSRDAAHCSSSLPHPRPAYSRCSEPHLQGQPSGRIRALCSDVWTGNVSQTSVLLPLARMKWAWCCHPGQKG